MKMSKLTLSAVAVLAVVSSAFANFTYDPLTYNANDATKGCIWFDTVGSMTYDGNGNPANVVGRLGDTTVKVDFFSSHLVVEPLAVRFTLLTLVPVVSLRSAPLVVAQALKQ